MDTEETSHLVPGFRDELLGLERGETRSFELTFPSMWKQKELQGVHARFTVNPLPVLVATIFSYCRVRSHDVSIQNANNMKLFIVLCWT